MPKPPKPISDDSKAELPNTQREGGSHVNEGNSENIRTPKQPDGPYDRGRQGRDKVDKQGLPTDESSFVEDIPHARHAKKSARAQSCLIRH